LIASAGLIAGLLYEWIHWLFCWQYYESSCQAELIDSKCLKETLHTKTKRLQRINSAVVASIPVLTFFLGFILLYISKHYGSKEAAKFGFLIGIGPILYGTAGTIILAVALNKVNTILIRKPTLRLSFKVKLI
jgi:hypothetical protein